MSHWREASRFCDSDPYWINLRWKFCEFGDLQYVDLLNWLSNPNIHVWTIYAWLSIHMYIQACQCVWIFSVCKKKVWHQKFPVFASISSGLSEHDFECSVELLNWDRKFLLWYVNFSFQPRKTLLWAPQVTCLASILQRGRPQDHNMLHNYRW